ncbi:hypothetical protein, partial [Corynebacterium amycolatum]
PASSPGNRRQQHRHDCPRQLTSQAAFQHLQAAQAQTQQCLDTATLTGIGRAMEHLQKAQDAGQRAGLIDQRRGGR